MNGARLPNGPVIVPDGWVEQATTTREASEGRTSRSGYGLRWWTTNGKPYRASGIFGQGIWIDPALKLLVVTHSAWPTATDAQSAMARQALIESITARLRRN